MKKFTDYYPGGIEVIFALVRQWHDERGRKMRTIRKMAVRFTRPIDERLRQAWEANCGTAEYTEKYFPPNRYDSGRWIRVDA